MNSIEKQISTGITTFLGMTVMTTAAVTGILELHNLHPIKQGSHAGSDYAHVGTKSDGTADERMKERLRREKEKTLHDDVSFSVSMRSHPTAGPA